MFAADSAPAEAKHRAQMQARLEKERLDKANRKDAAGVQARQGAAPIGGGGVRVRQRSGTEGL
eukprot:3834401-Pyramimonas_sp.AAC.1